MTLDSIKGNEIKDEYPFVSVVILNYNGKHHLKACLDSLLRTDYPRFEIILVDNGSTDGSVEFVQQNYPMVKLVRLRKNLYAAGGFMVGALVAKGEYVALLNNDIEVDPGWLKALMKYMVKMPWVAAADPKYKYFYQRDLFENSAAAGRWIDYFGNNCTRGVWEVDRGRYDRPSYIMCASTLFRRDVLLRIGNFDVSYLFGYEDADVTWRIYLAGYKALYVPEAVIYHKAGGTTRDKPGMRRPRPEFYYLAKRNRIISLIKNYGISNMLFSLLVTLLEYYFTLWYFMVTRQKTYGLAIFRAMLYPFIHLRKIMTKRAYVQMLKAVPDRVVKRYMVPYCGDIRQFLILIIEKVFQQKIKTHSITES
jgi:GT2 family glycosyltransferase